MSWFMERLLSKKDTLVSNELCQRIHDSLQILEKALDQYRSATIRTTIIGSMFRTKSRGCTLQFTGEGGWGEEDDMGEAYMYMYRIAGNFDKVFNLAIWRIW